MTESLAKEVKERWDRLDDERSTWKSHWEEVAEYVYPQRMGFTGPRPNGEKRGAKILDATGTVAHELLAAGLHGMASNPATTWFGLRMADPKLNTDAVREWHGDCRDRMFAAMHAPGAGVTTHLHELYLDYAALGTGIMWIGRSAITGRLQFSTRTLAECVIDENADGTVDTVVRTWKPTVRQAVQRFGLDALSEATRKKFADGKTAEKITILIAVFPRADRDPGKVDGRNKPFAHVIVEPDAKHVIEDDGVDEFPYAVPRWSVAAGEIYGRSPAMMALPDIKMLQSMTRDLLKAANLAVNPPLTVRSESTLGRISIGPGGLIYYRGDQAPTPLAVGANFPITLEMIQDVRQRIMQAFFVDQLQMIGDADMTATEVMQRTQERMRLLGPVLGRMEAELLGPTVDRVFGIMARHGGLAPAPDEVIGRLQTVEYVSPIAQAQRGGEVNGFLSYMQILAGIAAQAQRPEVLARVAWDEVPSWIGERLNVDARLTLDDDEFAAAKQATEAGQQLAAAQAAASAARDGAAALKDVAAAGTVQ